MGNKIRTKILLGRGKGCIHMLLHIPGSNILQGLGSPYERLLVPDFLVGMHLLVLLKGNLHICTLSLLVSSLRFWLVTF